MQCIKNHVQHKNYFHLYLSWFYRIDILGDMVGTALSPLQVIQASRELINI